jgi:hypothetical protein
MLEVTMRWTVETGRVRGKSNLLRWGFADWASEGHGLRLAALHINVDPLTKK